MNPQVKSGLAHAGSAIGGAVAAIGFMSSHGVDLYAIWDQLNVVIAAVTKLAALVAPVAAGAYGVYKASIRQQMLAVVENPRAADVAKTIPPTPQVVAVAQALTKQP